jgi:hypothetical protein
MKVLIPANEIPLGSTVTKKTGDKTYIIKNKIRIYGDPSLQKEIKADENVRFLVGNDANIVMITDNTELLWHVSDMDLYYYLYEKTQMDHR